MGKYELLPLVAGGLGLTSFATLVYRVYTTHNTTSLPYSWIWLNLAAQILAGTYGLLNQAWGIYGPSSVFTAGLIYVLYVKYYEQKYPKKPNGNGQPNGAPNDVVAPNVAPNVVTAPKVTPQAFNSHKML